MFTVTTAPHSFPPLTLKYRKFTIRSFTKPFLREPVYNRDLSKEREPGWGGGASLCKSLTSGDFYLVE